MHRYKKTIHIVQISNMFYLIVNFFLIILSYQCLFAFQHGVRRYQSRTPGESLCIFFNITQFEVCKSAISGWFPHMLLSTSNRFDFLLLFFFLFCNIPFHYCIFSIKCLFSFQKKKVFKKFIIVEK